MTFVEKLMAIEDGRFKKILSAIGGLSEDCGQCFSFNPKVKDRGRAYRCFCAERCPGAALSLAVKSYLWWKMGLITQEEHMVNSQFSNVTGIRPASERWWERIACRQCDDVFPEDELVDGLCRSCMTKANGDPCSRCGGWHNNGCPDPR